MAVLAGRRHPDQVSEDDLRRVRERLVADLRRAAHADSDQPAYDWWKVLFALYPNSPPTHAGRKKRPELDKQIATLFEEGEPDPAQLCVFCAAPASARFPDRRRA